MAGENFYELQCKYGKPTINDSIAAYYLLCHLSDMAAEVEYMHNFQLERSDIVEYVYKTHQIVKILKGDAKTEWGGGIANGL